MKDITSSKSITEFLKKGAPDAIAINASGKTFTYKELWHQVLEKSKMLPFVKGRLVCVYSNNPFTAVTNALSVIEAGGYAFIANELQANDLENTFAPEVTKDLIVFTDAKNVEAFKVYQIIEEDTNQINNLTKHVNQAVPNDSFGIGGVILATPGASSEAYLISMEKVQQHVLHTVSSFKINENTTVVGKNATAITDLLECVLPVLAANATLVFDDDTNKAAYMPNARVLLKLEKSQLSNEELEKLAKKYQQDDVEQIIVSSDARITNVQAGLIKIHFPGLNEIRFTHQLPKLPYSVIEGSFSLEAIKTKTLESLFYTSPFGKANVAILNDNHQPNPVNVPGNLVYESPALYVAIGKVQFIAKKQIRNNERLLRKLPYKAALSAKGGISLLNNSGSLLTKNNKQIHADIVAEALLHHSKIKDAVVRLVTNANKQLLVAFIRLEEGKTFSSTSILRKWLKRYVTVEMLPEHFEMVPEIHRTRFGIIEETQFENIPLNLAQEQQFNTFEETLATLWKRVLEVDTINKDDNFFELGGHSLAATKLVSLITNELKIQLAIKDVFLCPVFSEMIRKLQTNQAAETVEITARNIPDGEKATLSFAQERLWFIDQFQGSSQYNVPAVFDIKGKVNKELLSKAFSEIIQRHKALRTVIRQENGTAYQMVIQPEWELQYQEIKAKEVAQTEIQKVIDKPFNLSEDCMLRALLIKRNETSYTLVMAVHHIALDGWSAYILLDELREIYESGQHNKSPKLAEVAVQYTDYAIWQQQYISGEFLNKELTYWKNQLKDITYLELPLDSPRPLQQQFNGKRKTFTVANQVYENLTELSNLEGVTLFMTLLSAFKVLLYKYTGQKDVCVGSPIAGRHYNELENMVGFFANTLALRSNLEKSTGFTELLAQVKETTLAAYSHQDVPFEKIVDALGIEREMNRTPVFQVMFSMENVPELSELRMGDLILDSMPVEQETTQFDWNIYMEESQESGLVFHVEYDTDLFRENTIDRLGQHFNYLLGSIAANPDQPIAKLALMSKQEELKQIAEFNDNRANFSFDLTTDAIIDKIALQNPEKIAVKDTYTTRSYAALKEKASKIAGLLHQQIQISQETIVAIIADRSVSLIESVYGTWKAGGVYLPVHPELPQNRISVVLANAEAEVLFVTKKYIDVALALLKEYDSLKHIVCIDDSLDREMLIPEGCIFYDKNDIDAQQAQEKSLSNIDNLAYVIYTSGSTGVPKGAMVEHRGMLNHLFIMMNDLNMNTQTVIAQNASQSFDISVWQMFNALITGGTTVVYSHWETLQVQKFAEQLTKDQVTLLQLVPSYLTVLMDEMDNHNKLFFKDLEYLLVTGETIKKNLLERWFNSFPKSKVVNAYGPTEAADDITLYIMDSIPESSTISIGKSLSNLNIYVVNDDEQLCPVGVKGEIWVSGLGVGRGYLNDPEKTRKAFINDPFQGSRQARLYKTGDLGRFLPDGNLEFFGRKDYQVKVNGYRIELEEIEQYLSQLEQVKEAIVIVHESEPQITQLFGFVTCYNSVQPEDLKQELAGYLPDYMVPSRIIILDSFPLTPNGKVDRKKLPSLITTEKAISAPENEVISKTEKVLIEIWKELLELPEVGVNQSFFELGGHSLKVVSMISQIQKQLEAEVTIKDVFTSPTIKGLSSLIEKSNTVTFEPIPLVEKADYYPVSNAQKRLWVLDRFVEDVSAYNSYNAYLLKGSINVEAFSEAILSIINRHEVLRTTFVEKEGEPMQLIHTGVKKEEICQVINYSDSEKGYDEVIKELSVVANIPFSLSDELLFRSRIYILGQDTYVFFCCMHHIICDGWSNNILVKEILKNYRSFEKHQVSKLPSLKIQYKDFASWNLKQVASEEYIKHKEYWHRKLAGDLPVLALPSYHKRPAVQVFNGNAIEYTFRKEILDGLKQISSDTQSSLFITLTTFLNVLFYKYTGQQDIIIGTGTAGRTHPDLENQLGYYINTLALRNQINPDVSFTELIGKIKENTLEAFDHQDYPFDKLVNELDFERDISRNPIFDVMILLQSFDEDEDSLLADGLDHATINPITIEGHGSPFDMDFDFMEEKETLNLTLTFNDVIYTLPQMENMIKHLEILMKRVLENPTINTGAISIITKEEEVFITSINTTDKAFDLEKAYHHYLEKYAKETPDKTAVIFKDTKTTYAQLNAQSNQIARALQNHLEIEKDDLVGVFMDRSDQMMAAIFGIWKTTGAYIPLEKKMPDNRIVSCTNDAALKAVIADKTLVSPELAADLDSCTTLIYIQDLLQEAEKESANNLNLPIDTNNLCVTIFTSGSTGKPKGAMNEHKGRMNHALATIDYLNMNADSVLVQNASHSFDISIWQTFTPVVCGATTLIFEDELVNAPEQLLEKMMRYKATVFQLVPSYLSMLLEIISEDTEAYNLSLKNLICCGEAINPKSILKWQELYPETTFVNDYGPAEASDGTTWNVFTDIAPDTTIIPIGKPIYNMKNYLVDAQMNICPVGVIGEICVAGVGVGRGYVNDEERTQKAFFTNPFNKNEAQRLYKTGDLGKLLPNGMIQFYGRKDYQVKVNGQRIELGEIESKLLEITGVKEAAVIDKVNPANGRKYLVAFAALEEDTTLDATSLKTKISSELPTYMIPAEIRVIDYIPVTHNGKTNRKQLEKLAVHENEEQHAFVAPETDIELILAEAWKSVLNIDKVGTTDNFYELGGDSISAIQVSSYLYKNEYQVEVKDIMRFPHINEVAGFVKPLSRIADQGMISGTAELTPIQAAFFEMKKLVPNHYNQSVLLKATNAINTEAVAKSFSKILEWHDILRATFTQSSSGTYVQSISENCSTPEVETHNFTETSNPEAAAEVAEKLQASLSIENGPLLKVAVIHMKQADYLLIAIHHLVVDTVSWRIIVEDLTTAYQQILDGEEIALPAKTESFKVWSKTLKEFIKSDSFQEEVKYWADKTALPVEKLPYDYKAANTMPALVKDKKTLSVTLPADYVTKLDNEVHKAFNTEINDILLAALALSVKRNFGIERVPVMLESHGRVKLNEEINITRTVGWFTSEFPVFLNTRASDDLSTFIKTVKDHLHKVPNLGIGFGLLKFSAPTRSTQVTNATIPQIAFNYLGKVDDEVAGETIFQLEDDTLGNEESLQNQSDYALEIVGMGRGGAIEFTLEYHQSQFTDETVTAWMNTFKSTLQELIDFCSNRDYSEVTPTDFDYSDLSLQDLNELNDLF